MQSKIVIETYQVTKRKSECPIQNGLYKNDDYNHCEKCKFFSNGCCIIEYYLVDYKDIRRKSETDDDEYGGMPSTYYERWLKCKNCGTEIHFGHGMSTFVDGDGECCPNCGLYHKYLGYKDGKLMFGVPNNED